MIRARIIKAIIAGLSPLLLGLGAALFILLIVVSGSQEQSREQHDHCSASWTGEGVSGRQLSQSQLDAAATIYSAALETGVGNRGAVIGIATALQESDLGDAPGTNEPNEDGDMGLFQQRYYLGWYANGKTLEENKQILRDNAYASRTFFLGNDATTGEHIPGLVDIPNWQNLPLTVAAQKVQRSAFPDAYAKHESLAQSLVTKLSGGEAGPIVCGPTGPSGDCPIFNEKLENGLSPDAIRVLRCSKKNWPQLSAWSVLRPGDSRDHGKGKAVDVMIPEWRSAAGQELGQQVAEHYRVNSNAYGVTYIIWREQIWSVARAGEGWRSCAPSSCYTGPDDTAAHRDHVHISVHGNAGTGFTGEDAPATAKAVTPVAKDKYRLTARFNQRGPAWSSGFHTGLDFAAPTGTAIRAPVAGTVLFGSNVWSGSYGNLTKLQVDGDASTILYFAHQSAVTVLPGQKVEVGEEIGAVGNTGNSSGPHLHFEIRVNGTAVDPEVWLTQRGAQP